MGARAEQLASKLDQSCREINAAVERLSDAEWKTVASAEQWSVGVVAHHVAESHAEEAGFVQMIAKGQPVPPLTMKMIDEGNARHAREYANVTKAATLALLQANGAQALAMVRGLSDAELDRNGTLLVRTPPVTAAQAIQEILIDHVYEHLESIKATTKAKYHRAPLAFRPAHLVDEVVPPVPVRQWVPHRQGIPAGRTGTVTAVQRFGGGLNLNVHFHTLARDGMFVC